VVVLLDPERGLGFLLAVLRLRRVLARVTRDCCRAQGEADVVRAAIADFSKSLELGSQDAETWCNRGLARGMTNDLKGAVADCTKAIELRPDLGEDYYIAERLVRVQTTGMVPRPTSRCSSNSLQRSAGRFNHAGTQGTL